MESPIDSGGNKVVSTSLQSVEIQAREAEACKRYAKQSLGDGLSSRLAYIDFHYVLFVLIGFHCSDRYRIGIFVYRLLMFEYQLV